MNVAGGFSELAQLRPADVQDAKTARPLRWWPVAQLARLTADVQGLFDQWTGDWGLSTTQSDTAMLVRPASECVHAETGATESGLSWRSLSTGGRGISQGCWWTIGPRRAGQDHACGTRDGDGHAPQERAVAIVQVALFGSSSGGFPVLAGGTQPLAAASVAQEALEDWCQRLGRWLGDPAGSGAGQAAPTQGTLPAQLVQPWRGAVCLSIDWLGHCFQLMMDFSYAAHILGAHNAISTDVENTERTSVNALVPVQSALSGETLPVTVGLSSVELDLGTLAGLRVGDVVLIPHALAMPLLVRVGDGAPLFQAYLGRIDDQRAVELQPLGTAY